MAPHWTSELQLMCDIIVSLFMHLSVGHSYSCCTSEGIGCDIRLKLYPFPTAAVHFCSREAPMLKCICAAMQQRRNVHWTEWNMLVLLCQLTEGEKKNAIAMQPSLLFGAAPLVFGSFISSQGAHFPMLVHLKAYTYTDHREAALLVNLYRRF